VAICDGLTLREAQSAARTSGELAALVVLGALHGLPYRWGKAYGVPVVLVESVGRKSGKRRTHPLLCLPDGDNLVLIASKGGTDRHPAWYHNLKASPETTAWWKGERRRVRAREASGDERERLWRMMADAYPDYENYQRRTDRQIPVVVLEPV
jgi:deazaflavin-dependent oxidoreductase (nitroreductase family)